MQAVITGASSGFGKQLAIELAQSYGGPLWLSLVGRRGNLLEEVADEVQRSSCIPELRLSTVVADLAQTDDLDQIGRDLFASSEAYSRSCFFNNAGSVGPLSRVEELDDVDEIKRSIDLNVTSSLYLTSMYVRMMVNNDRRGKSSRHTVVNVSSLCALQPFLSMGPYCAGKAARDMFHQTLAKEHKGKECNLKVLNYAPGPMDTAMRRSIRTSPKTDITLKWEMEIERDVDVAQSAATCVKLVLADQFESGVHIDYFDTLSPERHP